MEELKQIIKDSGYKLQYIANYLDISRQALTRKLNGTIGWSTTQITTICKLLNIDGEALIRIFLQ